jgi:hypothetical protein
MSLIAGLARGAAAGFSGAGGGAAFSAAAGFASSSAMMRRIDARISSIEGSWTFAGCVISDSTSKPIYTKRRGIRWFRICRQEFSSIEPRLVPRSSDVRCIALGPASPHGNQTTRPKRGQKRRESLCCPRKRYVIATIDCKQAPVILRTTNYVSCHARLLHAGRHAPHDRSTLRPFARKRFRASDADATLSDRQACARLPSCHAPAGNARSHHTSWWAA